MKKILSTLVLIILSISAFSQCTYTVQATTSPPCMVSTGSQPYITVTGGIPPYEITCTQGTISFNSTFFLSPILPGVWFPFTIVDQSNCLIHDSLIRQFAPTSVLNYYSIPASCTGCCDGSVILNASGGIGPYSYYLLIPQYTAGSIHTGLCPGNYTGVISDSFGCSNNIICEVTTGNNYVEGNIYVDLNSNGIMDPGEYPFPNFYLGLSTMNMVTFTDINGKYKLYALDSNYILMPIIPTNWQLTSLPASYTLNFGGNNLSNYNFGVAPINPEFELEADLSNDIPRCNDTVRHTINIKNTGSAKFDSVSIALNYDPMMTYFNSTFLPINSGSNSLVWNLDSLTYFQQVAIETNFIMPGPGSQVLLTLVVNGFDGNGNLVSTDYDTLFNLVRCSYDPNMISVYPTGTTSLNLIPPSTELEYRIDFQNTGNDTAFDVTLINFIDVSLDISTLEVRHTSHPFRIEKNNSGLVQFIFSGINLPDSGIDQHKSHGYIIYKILTKNSLPDMTRLENIAYIIFDRNGPIATNTVFNTLFYNSPVNTPENSFSKINYNLFPNPCNDLLQITFDKMADYSAIISIVDAIGREVIINRKKKDENIILIRTENLSDGIYFVMVQKENKQMINSKLIVIQH